MEKEDNRLIRVIYTKVKVFENVNMIVRDLKIPLTSLESPRAIFLLVIFDRREDF